MLFINSQKSLHTHFWWPHISIIIKDGTNEVGVCCETIVSTKDLDIYTYILKSMIEMDEAYSLSNISLQISS